jgi:hypothetical protein
MRNLARRTYLRGFGIATAILAFGVLAQSAFAFGNSGGWG